MIFNVMENKEELLFALKELNEGEVTDISSNLEQYILHVSKTGETMFAWQLVKPLLTQKLRRVSDDFYTELPTDQMVSRPNMENVQYHDLQSRVIEHINKFSGTPFTIQRLCELLVNPRSHYTRPDKFLRGIEKIVMVVSTVEAMKVANGSTTNSSSHLSDDEGSVSDAEKSVTGSGGLVNGVWGGPPTPPGAVLSPNRPSSPALDLTDRPDRPGPLSPTHPLSTTASQSHSTTGGDGDVGASHLRPMGQLEAFVQTVSQRLSSPTSTAVVSNGTNSSKEEDKGQKNLTESHDDSSAVKEIELPDSMPSEDDLSSSEKALEKEPGSPEEECDSSEKLVSDDVTPIEDRKEADEAESSSDRREDRKRELSSSNKESTLSSSSSECVEGSDIAVDEPPAKYPRLDTSDSETADSSSPQQTDTQDNEVSESGQEQRQNDGEEEMEKKETFDEHINDVAEADPVDNSQDKDVK